MNTAIIGIDCATVESKMGLARAVMGNSKPVLIDAEAGDSKLIPRLAGWIGEHRQVLLALDAPLGWPSLLGPVLQRHRAGQGIEEARNALFRRLTDDVIAKEVGPRPLDVGADRIARTAHAALSMLDQLRDATGESIPLAWTAVPATNVEAIEVYPAATLRALGLPSSKYKAADQGAVRNEIITGLERVVEFDCDIDPLHDSADILDAVVCTIAGVDFIEGRVGEPTDTDRARREGWIWARRPET